MLYAKLLMFSRSHSEDYRWIYSDPLVTQKDKSSLMNDYRAFELDRNYFLTEKHLVVRRLENASAVFRFSRTGRTDNYTRPIFALTGLVFTGDDLEIVDALSCVIIPFLYLSDSLFDSNTWAVSDSLENSELPVELSLDRIVDAYRSNPDIKQLADKLSRDRMPSVDNALLVTQRSLSPMKTEPRTATNSSLYAADIDALLNSYGTDSAARRSGHAAEKPSKKRKSGRGFWDAVRSYLDTSDD